MLHRRTLRFLVCLAAALRLSAGVAARAEDGYRLWLRYDPLPGSAVDAYCPRVTSLVVPAGSATLDAIRTELVEGCSGLLGRRIPTASDLDRDGAVVVGTPASSPIIAGLDWGRQLAELGPEGFRLRSVKLGRYRATVIASAGEVGALYGAFHFLRLHADAPPDRRPGRQPEAPAAPASARSLGQPRRRRRARLRRAVPVALGVSAGDVERAAARLRPG